MDQPSRITALATSAKIFQAPPSINRIILKQIDAQT